LKILALIAAGKSISASAAFIVDQDFIDLINNTISGQNLSVIARRRLSDLIMTLPVDDLLIPLGAAVTQVGMTDPSVASEIVGALRSKWLGFGPMNSTRSRSCSKTVLKKSLRSTRFSKDTLRCSIRWPYKVTLRGRPPGPDSGLAIVRGEGHDG
jgi:hypothetical protein